MSIYLKYSHGLLWFSTLTRVVCVISENISEEALETLTISTKAVLNERNELMMKSKPLH